MLPFLEKIVEKARHVLEKEGTSIQAVFNVVGLCGGIVGGSYAVGSSVLSIYQWYSPDDVYVSRPTLVTLSCGNSHNPDLASKAVVITYLCGDTDLSKGADEHEGHDEISLNFDNVGLVNKGYRDVAVAEQMFRLQFFGSGGVSYLPFNLSPTRVKEGADWRLPGPFLLRSGQPVVYAAYAQPASTGCVPHESPRSCKSKNAVPWILLANDIVSGQITRLKVSLLLKTVDGHYIAGENGDCNVDLGLSSYDTSRLHRIVKNHLRYGALLGNDRGVKTGTVTQDYIKTLHLTTDEIVNLPLDTSDVNAPYLTGYCDG